MSKIRLVFYKKRFYIPTMICIFFAICICFHKPLVRYGIEKGLGYVCPMPKGWKVKCRSLVYKKDRVIFSGCSLVSKDYLECQIEDVEFFYTERRCDLRGLNIDLIQPSDVAFSVQDLMHTFLGTYCINIFDGKTTFLFDAEKVSMLFSFLRDETKKSSAYLSLGEKEKNMLITLHSWPDEVFLESSCKNISLKWLTKIYENLFLTKKLDWQVTQGFLQGNYWIGLENDGNVSQAKVNLQLSNIESTHTTYGCSMHVANWDLDLTYPIPTKDTKDPWWKQTRCKSLIHNGVLAFQDPIKEIDFSLINIDGEVQWNTLLSTKMALEGTLQQKGYKVPIVLNANPNLLDKGVVDFDLQFLFDPEHNFATSLHFGLSLDQDNSIVLRGALQDLDAGQAAMFSHILSFTYPEIKDFHLKSGKISCAFSVCLDKNKLDTLHLEKMQASDVELYLVRHNTFLACDHIEANAEINVNTFLKNPFSSWDVAVRNGNIFMGGVKPFELSSINMQVCIEQDVFAPSWIQGIYEGIDIHCDLLGNYQDAETDLRVLSSGEKLLARMFPEKKDWQAFSDQKIRTDLEIRQKKDCWHLVADVFIEQLGNMEKEIHFDLDIDQISPYEFLQKPLFSLLQRGSFTASEFSCKLLAWVPIYYQQDWILEGNSNLSGHFDKKILQVHLEESDLHFYSPLIDIQWQNSKNEIGFLQYDFVDQNWSGNFCFQQAQVLEKICNSTYQDSQGKAYFHNQELFVEHFVTDTDGLIVNGNLHLDLSAKKGMRLNTHVNQVTGTFLQLQNFLNRFSESKKEMIPLDGRINMGEKGLSLCIDTTEEKTNYQWDAEIYFNHGTYKLRDEIAIQDVGFILQAHSDKDLMVFRNLTANIVSNKTHKMYTIYGPYIEKLGKDCTFDLRFANEMMDFFRFKGSLDLKSKKFQWDSRGVECFGTHPEICQICLDDQYALKECNLNLQLPVRHWVDIWHLYEDIFQKEESSCMENLHHRGQVQASINFKDQNWHINCTGKDLEIESFCWKNCSLQMAYMQNNWIIDSLVLDATRFSGRFIWQNSFVDLLSGCIQHPDINMRFGQGFYDLTTKKGKIKIHEGHMNLLPWLQEQGTLSFTGTGEISIEKELANSQVTAFLQLHGENIGAEEIQLVSSNTEIILEQDKISIKDSPCTLSDKEHSIHTFIAQLEYYFAEQNILGRDIKVHAEPQALCSLLQKYIPKDKIPTCTSQEIGCTCSFEYGKEQYNIEGSFTPGEYVYDNTTYSLDAIKFALNEKEIYFSLQTSLYDCPTQWNFYWHPYTTQEFSIQASVIKEDSWFLEKKSDLCIQGKLLDFDEIIVQSIHGDAFGCQFSFFTENLIEDAVYLPLLGTCKIDMDKLIPYVSPAYQKKLQDLQMHKGFEINGSLLLNTQDLTSSIFKGSLQGKDFDFFGFKFKTLMTDVYANKQLFELKNIKLSDPAVMLQASLIEFKKDQDWHLSCPEMKVTGLQPSLLRKKTQSQKRIKPFRIEEMFLQDMQGNLSDLNSLTGKGFIRFVNTFKEGYTLLDIPLELISRLGLDMGLLVPIQGEMEYNIKNQKIAFTKLKNCFSESQRSYFYLWNKTDSFIDFSGDMHIDIRMKQYVIFKITELFILSVEGSITNPKFSLK